MSCSYYTEKTPDDQRFSVSVEFKNNTCEDFLVLNLCSSYVPDPQSDESDMVFIKIDLPSGYTYQGGTEVNENIKVKIALNSDFLENQKIKILFAEN